MKHDNQWEALLVGCSVPIRQLDADLNVVDLASGCIAEFRGRRILLTVQHATGNEGNWAVEVGFDPSRGTKLYQLGPMNFFVQFQLGQLAEFVDLSYVRIPDTVTPLIQDLNVRGEVFGEAERLVLNTALDQVPTHGSRYGFAGLNYLFHADRELHTELRVEADLSFVREEGGMYTFSLNHRHPGDWYYKGCSGAPVLSHAGDLIGLVVGGCEKDDTVNVISLAHYRGALEVSLIENEKSAPNTGDAADT